MNGIEVNTKGKERKMIPIIVKEELKIPGCGSIVRTMMMPLPDEIAKEIVRDISREPSVEEFRAWLREKLGIPAGKAEDAKRTEEEEREKRRMVLEFLYGLMDAFARDAVGRR